MTEMDGKSEDLVQDNIQALTRLFPEVACDGKVDFNKLRNLLGDAIDNAGDRYNFTWHGKDAALRLSQTPSMGTLRPCKAQSKDWDTTQNLYIEGDNLEVLKLLQKSYHGRVKMIYIDPPYNTGNDFVYHDDFRDNLANYQRLTGQADEAGKVYTTNSETSGRYHTDWLNMIYPRLRLARNLLRDDGAIFISIDDHEQGNLKKICDEVFGEDNFLINAIWINGRTSASHFTKSHEYVIGYAKNINQFPLFKYKGEAAIISDRTIKKPGLKNPPSDIDFPSGIEFRCPDKIFPKKFGDKEPVEIVKGIMECRDGKLKNPITVRAGWTMKDMICNWLKGKQVYDQKGQLVTGFFFKENGVLQYEKEKGTIHPNSVITGITTKSGSNRVSNLLDVDAFSFPKPVELIEYLSPMVEDGDIVLDFFSGSASTADAVMNLNAEDHGNRHFILVQLPETCPDTSDAAKAGYKNICEIGEERIRRAGQSIKDSCTWGGDTLDVGFRVFQLDTSNLKKWQLPTDADDLEQTLMDAVSNILPGRTEEDLLYEIVLKMGFDLAWPIETRTVADTQVFVVADGALFICLADRITPAVAEGMAQLHRELAPEVWKVVCRDTGFRDDAAKVNVREILKAEGLDDAAFVTV